MTDLRHDEPCSSPSPVSGLVDTATLTERLLDLADFEGFEDAKLLKDAAAALSALEKRPSIGFVQSLADANADLLARAVDAEAREKAQRQTAEHNWQERVAAEAREKALSEALERIKGMADAHIATGDNLFMSSLGVANVARAALGVKDA